MRFSNAMLGADPRDFAVIAVAAERAGFDSVALSDHVFYPEQLESKYPYTPDGKPQFRPEEAWPDPWVAVGAMAAYDHVASLPDERLRPAGAQPVRGREGGGHGGGAQRRLVALGIGAGGCARSSSRWANRSPSGGRGYTIQNVLSMRVSLGSSQADTAEGH